MDELVIFGNFEDTTVSRNTGKYSRNDKISRAIRLKSSAKMGHLLQEMSHRQAYIYVFPLSFCYLSTLFRVFTIIYRGADKSLARPGRKQSNISFRMA